MKILFSSYPLYGHLIPMLPLALAAQEAGHEVRVSTSGELAARVEQYGLSAWKMEKERDNGTFAYSGKWIPGLPMEVSARLRTPEMIELAEGWKPEIIIHEPIDFAAPIVAARLGAPCFVHGLGPMVPLQIYKPLSVTLKDLYSEWGVPNLVNELHKKTYLDVCPPSLQNEGVRVWEKVRPLRPVSFEPGQRTTLPAGFDALPYEKTIHLTLGTVVNKIVSIFQAVLAGLKDLEANVVVTVGPDGDPELLGPQPRHVIVERFIPHGLLLPRCSLVINHAGNGSVLAALSHGLPMLLLPQGADQFLTAAACKQAGAALILTPEKVTSQAVKTAVECLLSDRRFAAVAGQLRSEIASLPAPREVIESISNELQLR